MLSGVLEQIDNSDFPELDLVELNACPGGCVGGVMTVTNPYIAKARLQSLRRYLPVAPNQSFEKNVIPDYAMSDSPVEYVPERKLAEDRSEAIRMMSDIQEIRKTLPGYRLRLLAEHRRVRLLPRMLFAEMPR